MFSDRTIITVIVTATVLVVIAITLQISYSGAFGEVRKGELVSGYWGPMDSSVDWCEENYVSTPYVAEIFNSFTSVVPMLGGLGILICALRINSEYRFVYTGIASAVVGIGSIAFHGSLRRGTQAMDEVPMVWVVFISNYSAWEISSPRGKKTSEKLPYLVFISLIFLTYLNVFTEGQLAALTFHLSFAPSFLGFIYVSFRFYQVSKTPEIKAMYGDCFMYISLAGACWAVDNTACALLQHLPFGLPNPQLHAWGWHVFIGYGAYLLQLAMMATRKEKLEEPCVVRYLWFCPYLEAVELVDVTKMNGSSNGQLPSTKGTNGATSPMTKRASSSRKKK